MKGFSHRAALIVNALGDHACRMSFAGFHLISDTGGRGLRLGFEAWGKSHPARVPDDLDVDAPMFQAFGSCCLMALWREAAMTGDQLRVFMLARMWVVSIEKIGPSPDVGNVVRFQVESESRCEAAMLVLEQMLEVGGD